MSYDGLVISGWGAMARTEAAEANPTDHQWVLTKLCPRDHPLN
jgi:hypothetical protein